MVNQNHKVLFICKYNISKMVKETTIIVEIIVRYLIYRSTPLPKIPAAKTPILRPFSPPPLCWHFGRKNISNVQTVRRVGQQ